MKIRTMFCLAVLFWLTVASPATAQSKEDSVAMRRVTVVIQYADGRALERLLNPYLTKAGRVHWESNTRALTLVDEPAVVDVMLKMIKKFDVRLPQIKFSLQLVLAKTEDKPGKIPAELKKIARQLKEVFSYNQFEILDKAYLTLEANKESRLKLGGEKDYTVDMSTQLLQGAKPAIRLILHLYKQEWIKVKNQKPLGTRQTLIETTVEMKSGETTILGASKINGEGKALITIVTMTLK